MFISDRFLGKRRIHYVLNDRVCCQKLSLFSLPSVQYLHQIYLAALPNKRGKFIWLVCVELSIKPSEQAWFWHASAQCFHGEIIAVIFDFCSRRRLGRESNLHQGGRDGQKEGKGRGGVITKKGFNPKHFQNINNCSKAQCQFFFVCFFSFSSDSWDVLGDWLICLNGFIYTVSRECHITQRYKCMQIIVTKCVFFSVR